MGIEQFVLDKGSSLFHKNTAGEIDNKLAEIVLALSKDHPVHMDFYQLQLLY